MKHFFITLLFMLPIQGMAVSNPAMVPIINYLLSDTRPLPQPVTQKYTVTPIIGTSSQVVFTITLTERPDSNVTITYSSMDETVALPTNTQITFTPDDWYRAQSITVDILNKYGTTEITFEPSVSDDLAYNHMLLDDVSIVSHQILIHEPYDKIVYSEFDMSIPINVSYVGDYDTNLTVTLDSAPATTILDKEKSKLLWRPELIDEDTNTTVELTVSDGYLSETLSFDIRVASPIPLATTISADTLTITDSNFSLNGLSIKALDGAILSDYNLYRLIPSDVPASSTNQSVGGETLLIKGNVGKKVQVTLPLQGLVTTDELLSFHTNSYFGSDQLQRIDYEYNFLGTVDEPIYELNTTNLFGLVSFIKESQSEQAFEAKTNISQTIALATTGINCEPQTWSLLGLVNDLTDYNNQICTFDSNPGFGLQVFNYPNSNIASIVTIEEVASWVIASQNKLNELNMPYKPYSGFSFEKINESHGNTVSYGSAKGSFFVNYPTLNQGKLSKVQPYLSIRDSRLTVYHEYFHQSQFEVPNNTLSNDKAKWLHESSAVWFSDFVDNNSGYAYEMLWTHIRLLSYGLPRLHTEIMPEGFGQGQIYIFDSTYYHRGIFLEMVDNYCPNFTNYIPYLFTAETNDLVSLQHLANAVYSSQCNFGTPIGVGNESFLETALLYYQYVSAIKNDKTLINPNLGTYFNFSGAEILHNVTSNDWLPIGLDEYQNISSKGYLHSDSIDSQAMTMKFDRMQDTVSRCEERYIRIESEQTILVSLASNDTNFPDTPSTMLGDMKQINFGMSGKTDFTYFYDAYGQQVYPELYLTIIDVIDDTETLSPQTLEIGTGHRRTNLLSHIDAKDMCAEYVQPITQTNVIADGIIPQQYRDINEPLQYIDRIKMTCLESGEVFYATVGSNGSWLTTIDITFNGNESRFYVDGYNSSDNQRIIARQGLTIVR